MVTRKLITCIRKPNIRLQRSRIVRWARHVAHIGENRIAYRVFGEETRRENVANPRAQGGGYETAI